MYFGFSSSQKLFFRFKMIQTIILILLVSHFVTVHCDLCSNICDCREQQFVDCSSKRLEEIPEDIPSWVLKLKLDWNLLRYMSVSSPMNLTCLTLSHNRIIEINRETFEKLPLLDTLDFNGNHLAVIRKEVFSNATKLKVLNLSNNNIANIENGSFSGLTMLSELKLNRNNLTVLHKDMFTNITNLKYLEVNRNHLKEIVSLTFAGLKNLLHLKMRQNNIASLQDGAFHGLSNLTNLHLDYNKITEVSYCWLFGLKKLNHLTLSHNMIRRVNRGWQFTSLIRELDLSHNKLDVIEVDTLQRLSMLKNLKLNDNSIASIAKGAFNHTPDLVILDLHNNNLSWTFEDTNGVFLGLNRLAKLDLAGNMITAISPKAFLGLDSLQELNLRGNNILTIQENPFKFLPNMNNLEMNTTSLVCDCTLAWFPGWFNRTFRSLLSFVQASCGYPNLLKGKNVTQVPHEDFICSPDDSPKPVIIEEPISRVALAGADISLPCTGKSSSETPLTFKWKRNKKRIKEESIASPGGIQRVDLKLINVSVSDSAKYQCIISNAFGTAYSHKVNLSILVYPKFVKKPSNITAKAGGLARLECAAIGQPPPQIAWQKDGGKEFPAAQERRMHVMPTDDVFFLVNVRTKDSGIYTCSATNAAGTIVANASLTVFGSDVSSENMTMGESSVFTRQNITGVIMITVVCCAVITSAVWVIIIYHTRRRLRPLILHRSTSDN